MKIYLKLVIIASVVILVSARSFAESDPVVAIVNGKEIVRSEILRAKTLLPKEYKTEPLEVMFPGLLNSVIDSYLAADYARSRNMHESEEFVTDMARIERQVLHRVALRKIIREGVTDEDTKAHFLKLKRKMADKEEIRVRHILVETEEKAKEIISSLDEGEDFESVAKRESIGPSKDSGGDLGYFGRGQMVPSFEEAAFKLEQGVYTSIPIKTKFGWHIILSVGKRKGIQVKFDEVKEKVRNQLTQQVVGNLLRDLRKSAEIEKFNLDGSRPKKK